MASWLPGIFQKRLLKYALSRLEFIDTEALDPDSLGIRWGQRSTVELRDIGLRLEKIATLLNLPASSKLLGARVRLLRLTVPADIHSSGIICEVSGVEAQLRLPSEKDACAVKDRLFEGQETIIPNPTDLAESFLQTEPKEEKEELQAAISTRSEILHRTTASISDDEEELGLGDESISLPSFIAAFLKGIADRLQFQIEDISLRVDMETKQDGSSKRQPEDKPDLISAFFSVHQASVGAVVTTSPTDEHSLYLGKRPVSFSDVDLAIVAEPIVFSNYSRFTAPGSPSTNLPSKSSQASSPISSIPRAPSSVSSSSHAMMASTIFEPSHQMMDPLHTEHDSSRLYESAYTYDGRFSDADTEETRSHGYLEHSQTLSDDERLLDNPAYLDSVIDSQLHDDDLDELDDPPPEYLNEPEPETSTPRLHGPGSQVLKNGVTRSIPNMSRAAAASEPNVRDIQTPHPRDESNAPLSSMPDLMHPEDISRDRLPTIPVRPTLSTATSSSSSASSFLNDDLSESKLFSSEQAQSMYMSAMSHGSNSRSFMPNMPGGWESPEATMTHGNDHHRDFANHIDGATELFGDDQEPTPVSTPKPTDHEASFPLDHASFTRFSDAHSDPTDHNSARSTSDVNETADVAKRFLHVDRITLWIPSVKQGEHPDPSESIYSEGTGQPEDSTAHLEASQTAEKSVSFGKIPLPLRTRRESIDLAYPEPKQKFDIKHGRGASGSEHDIRVEISSIEIQFDIAIGWLAVKFGQRFLQAFGGNGQANTNDKAAQKDVQDPQPFSFTLGKMAIKFVENVPGNAFPPVKQEAPASFLDFLHNDVILQTTASGLKAHFSGDKDKTRFSAEISKFTIGFASEDLISFSDEFKMRESTRDILAPVGNDISLSLKKTQESATFTISTLPLHVNLSIPRLEELLGWFGGLSTIMELGSSISSLSVNKTPKKNAPRRGVRFENVPSPSFKTQAASIAWGVNARVGGVALDVTGESHYLTLRSTAAKIVSRPDYVGLSIDKVWLDGPFSLHDSRDAPININLNVIRVEYLYTPTDQDLDRLLSLITPSKARYGEEDDIMVGTLLRQRKQGSVLRVTVKGAKAGVTRPDLGPLQQLGEELGRLSTVAKYLPEDDRPGILTLALIRDLEAEMNLGGMIGTITVSLQDAEAAHISIPSLIAAQLGSINVVRNDDEELVGEAIPSMPEPIPVLMVRFIADEMDPTIKVKLHNLRVEYTISAITALLGISDEMESCDVAANMANSLANIAELHPPSRKSSKEERPSSPVKPLELSVDLLDSVISLNPRGTAARGLVVLTQSRFSGDIHDLASSEATLDLKKVSVLIIDDEGNLDTAAPSPRRRPASQTSQVQAFLDMGYVLVSSISSATATVKIMRLSDNGTKSLDVEIRDDLLILETCADSTQTLISILNGLQPPSPPSVAEKYRTQVVPIQNMLESFTGDAFATGGEDASSEVVDAADIPQPEDLEYVTDFDSPGIPASGAESFNGKFQSQYHVSSSMSELDFQDDHFMQKSSVGGTAHRWDSTQNTYGLADNSKLQKSPLRVRVRDAHVIWNLFDGYDWQRTRDTISQAVKEVEKKAAERRSNDQASPGFDDDEGDVIGDCLFNSVYIGIPANRDPSELREGINRNIDDVISETGSYATTSTATTIKRNTSPGVKRKKLRLSRSKAHKMTFELKGICADLVVFPPSSGETLNSLDVRVNELIIFDHIPTSTWKKFATYMREAGEKEAGTSMVHLEILTVKPVSELAASELILKVTVLPLRLHVDQDALDFLTRFFEFRDDSVPPSETPQERPYLQRSEVNAIPVKLDFKPKRVDYAGLRSGRTTEFMNFIILEEADMVLKRVIVYGADGFDKLGQTLNDTWMPEIKQNQLPGILAGLAPIRPLVNVGSGVRDLVMVPMREYRKDGRIVRSIQKGAFAFGKTTSNELVKLGAKLAIGTQTVLQGAEELFNTSSGQPVGADEDEIHEDEAARKISLYADQPLGVVQGLRGGFRGLERDLLLTRDAIIAMPGDVQESGSAKGAAKAVLKRAPTVILRPAIGISKAVGQTLLGAGNSLDPGNRRKIEDKYKRH